MKYLFGILFCFIIFIPLNNYKYAYPNKTETQLTLDLSDGTIHKWFFKKLKEALK